MVARVLLLGVSVGMVLVVAEVAARVWYRDAGARTLGGPGGASFEHETRTGGLRGRLDAGPRTSGTPRLLIVGDSITYGAGITDWRQTWPEVLARSYEQSAQPIELAVLASPGRGPTEHIDEMRRYGAHVAPDAFIYQWYVNDLEVDSIRPATTVSWHRFAWHTWLTERSYLYYLVDHLIAGQAAGSQYVDYITHQFAPGSREWMAFERAFHELSTRATLLARTRILMLYPQVPFRERYPLEPIHQRVRALAGRHALSIAPVGWIRSVGQLSSDDEAPWKQVVSIPKGVAGVAVDTPAYAASPGALDIAVQFRVDDDLPETVGTLELIDAQTGAVLAALPIHPTASGKLQTVALHAEIAGDSLRHINYRVRSSGAAAWRLAAIDLDVDYGYEVVDLTDALNAFDTHVTAFDSHPNAAAHQVMAQVMRSTLDRLGALRPSETP